MGRSLSKGVVPFKVEIWEGDIGETDDAPKYVREAIEHGEDDSGSQTFERNGWVLDREGGGATGRYGELFVDPITKGNLKVYYINENQYANGGGMEFTVFADTEEALQEFLKDVMPEQQFTIKQNQAVTQSL